MPRLECRSLHLPRLRRCCTLPSPRCAASAGYHQAGWWARWALYYCPQPLCFAWGFSPAFPRKNSSFSFFSNLRKSSDLLYINSFPGQTDMHTVSPRLSLVKCLLVKYKPQKVEWKIEEEKIIKKKRSNEFLVVSGAVCS